MTMQEGLFLAAAGAALLTVLVQYLRSRNKALPYTARHDIKARRLWRCDPQAYERKFGAADQQVAQAQRTHKSS